MMTNLEKYDRAFLKSLGVKKEELPDLVYRRHKDWDSIGHMDLIVQLEETFDISIGSLDVTSLSSYENGKEILAKYGVDI